ncbi:MAG: type III-A CRISPR-associated RAMP protein Csm4, partial [Chloroflexi bacterium]
PKNLKKVAYISEGIFRILIEGSSLAKEWHNCEKLHGNTVLLTKEEREKLPEEVTRKLKPEAMWKVARQPRVTIDRIANKSSIYHTGQVLFNKDGGLWFGLRWLEKDAKLKKQMEHLFVDLGYAGLGGERSSGYGVCEITPHDEIQLPAPEGKPWVSLSRYIPKEEEIFALGAPNAAYQIESVGGWVRSIYGKKAQRRMNVNILAEGAVLGALDVNSPGMMVDAQPNFDGEQPLGHPAYRNGFALGVGIEGGLK